MSVIILQEKKTDIRIERKIKMTTEELKQKLLEKAYNTGRLTDSEFRFLIIEMTLNRGETILDTGNQEMVNAEFVLRLKGKERKMNEVFWRERR